MSRSLSFAAYRALSRRRKEQTEGSLPPRPDGELVWAHATDDLRFAALRDLGRRLRVQRPDLQLLLTVAPSVAASVAAGAEIRAAPGEWICPIDGEHPGAARRFVDHWRPDLCIWTGGMFLMNVLSAASEKGVPLVLADFSAQDISGGRRTWIPSFKRASLDVFDHIFANGLKAAEEIRRLGVRPDKVRAVGRLRPGALPPDCNEDDLAWVTGDLASRPAWLAVGLDKVEFNAILSAHRAALRLSHRLLLIVTLADPTQAGTFRDRLHGSRLRYSDWEAGEGIEDNMQVLLVAGGEEMGLWYRVAPLCFIGNTLTDKVSGHSPLDAAALGVAVLFGPQTGSETDTYERLAAAGAARKVNDAASLGAAVTELVAPDRAASMALAGWQVVTEGAETANQLIELIQELLDQHGGVHATT